MIVLDASVAAKLILAEPHSDKVLALLTAAVAKAEPIIAPPLLPFEIANILRQRMVRQGLSLVSGRSAHGRLPQVSHCAHRYS